MRASIDAVSESARAVTTAIVIERGDEMVGVVRILGYCRLVLGLPATGQVRVADVEAVLIDFDVEAESLAASVVLHRNVRSRARAGWRYAVHSGCRRIGSCGWAGQKRRLMLIELVGSKSGHQPFLQWSQVRLSEGRR